MKIGIPAESYPGEMRVATTPELIEKFVQLGFSVCLQSGSGSGASFTDEAYKNAGAEIVGSAAEIWKTSELILKVRGPSSAEVGLMQIGQTLISFIWPGQNPEVLNALAAQKVTVLAMDCIPRISRAQKMDALSSMANIAGYRAVIEAAHVFGRFFTGQITAAGKVPPAQVFVIGAGVAGLSAIGTAASLGAVVRANDTRPEVADQVKSMGGIFVGIPAINELTTSAGGYARAMSPQFLEAQAKVFAQETLRADIVITTALIPGQKAPVLITEKMVQAMKPGSVIVDLAAEQGGNCALTEAGTVVKAFGVSVIGYTDLPSRLAKQASTMYGNNLFRLVEELTPNKNGQIEIRTENEVVMGAMVVRQGQTTWPPLKPTSVAPLATSAAPAQAAKIESLTATSTKTSAQLSKSKIVSQLGFVALILLIGVIGYSATDLLISQLTVFVLSSFVGYLVVWNVTPALHTPLMSVTNAISSIIIIGALMQISSTSVPIQIISFISIVLTATNMFGGFAVTQRMLKMFRK